jgi:hypothetical protein
MPGATQPCYSGPPGTVGKGICKAGLQTCNVSGTAFGPCIGEILPQTENCGTPEDDDCDGIAPRCPPTHLWSKAFGTALDQEPTALAVDPQGNVIVVGYIDGTVDFGCGPLAGGASDGALVVKFSSAGDCVWSRRFGDPAMVEAVAIDAAGSVYVTGYETGAIDFGGGVLSGNNRDVFVAKLDASGAYQWGKRFGDSAEQTGWGVTPDSAGDVIITGSFQGTVDFGGGPLTSQGGTDIFLAKFGPTGAYLWSKTFGDGSNQLGRALTVDAQNNVLLTGNIFGPTNFGGPTLDASSGLGNVFIAKLSPTGGHVWSKVYGDWQDQFSQTIKLDASGNLYACGGFQGVTDFGGGPLTSAGGQDAWFVKLDAAGNHLWSRRAGGQGNQSCNNVAVDAAGRMAFGGWFYGSGDFGGPTLVSAGQQDGYLALYDASGNHLWSMLYGDSAAQANKGIGFDAAGNLFLTAFLTGPIDLGGGPRMGGGGEDILIAKLKP